MRAFLTCLLLVASAQHSSSATPSPLVLSLCLLQTQVATPTGGGGSGVVLRAKRGADQSPRSGVGAPSPPGAPGG